MEKKMTNMGIDRIKEILPNRYPYLLIDKVLELEPGKRARGYKNLTANEWFFPVHFPEEPMMPGMVQMEALLQMLSLTVLALDGNAGKSIRGIAAQKIRLKKRVVPGVRLDIEAELTSWENGTAIGKATGFIDEEEACSGEFTFCVADGQRRDTHAE